MRRGPVTWHLLLLLASAGCPQPPLDADGGPEIGEGEGEGEGEPDAGPLAPIPALAWPCDEREHWPRSVASETYPFVVHHRPGEGDMAILVRDLLDVAWRVEMDELGFSPPVSDDGWCGDDERFDVFLWNGNVECYVDVIDEVPGTTWNDWSSYMVVDAWGPYGGAYLDVTLAHELNHASQAADDWWETGIAFEMTATFLEQVVFPDDDSWTELLGDFQGHPDWSLDRYDDYATWYMYAAALYLHFLRVAYFDGDASFAAEMWRRSRNPPWPNDDPLNNEPDIEDALDELLSEAEGASFEGSVVRFARWRYYTGARDDGQHFPNGDLLPDVADLVISDSTSAASSHVISPAPMYLGTTYVEVTGAPGATVQVSLDADPTERFAVQALPGLAPPSDGDTLDVANAAASFTLDAGGARVLAVTALPPAGPDGDPDARDDSRVAVTLVLSTP
jgi:hypothetical protein